MLSFYFDEHVDPWIANALQSRGIDALTALSAGRAGKSIPDPMQLAYAAVMGRVFVSGDWDFLAYAGTVHPHAGVVIIPRHVSLGDAILYLEIVATTARPDDDANRLLVYPASLKPHPLLQYLPSDDHLLEMVGALVDLSRLKFRLCVSCDPSYE